MTTKYSPNWGGKRPGAGRPGNRRRSIGVRLLPDIFEKLRTRARENQLPLSRQVEQLLASVL